MLFWALSIKAVSASQETASLTNISPFPSVAPFTLCISTSVPSKFEESCSVISPPLAAYGKIFWVDKPFICFDSKVIRYFYFIPLKFLQTHQLH